jgi:hypothetical protein
VSQLPDGIELSELEQQLRAARAAPSSELEREVLECVSGLPRRSRRGGRLLVAALVTAAALATAAFLGVGNSKGDRGGVAASVAQVRSASRDQYGGRETICHQANTEARAVTLRLATQAASRLLQEFPLDSVGPCT